MAATTLANRALNATTNHQQTIALFRLSFNLLKSFSTSPSPSASASDSNSKKPKRKKKKNLFDVVQYLPNWGIGYHLAKSHWDEVSYEITKIRLDKYGRKGKAWGLAHKNGLPIADAPKKISGVHKRCWRYIPSLSKSLESKPTSPKSTETAAKAEVETA